MLEPISFESVLEHLKDGVCVVSDTRKITFWNGGAERITGFSREEAIGRPYGDGVLVHCDKHGGPAFPASLPVDTCFGAADTSEHELYLRRKDGTLAPVFTRISPVTNARGEVIGALEVFSDNSSKVQALERIVELEEMALICPITGVGNRRYSELTLSNAFDELRRFGWSFGLLFVDVDHFKRVNDEYGHTVGDQVLRMVAHAMKDTLRALDYVGRWGGEEFILVLPNITDDILRRVAERCRLNVEESSFHAGGEEIRVTISVGGIIPSPEEGIPEGIQRADQLMYRSKQAGRNRVTTDAGA